MAAAKDSRVTALAVAIGNDYQALDLRVDALESATGPDLSNYATNASVDTKIAALVDSSPTTLNTLNELAAALGDDPNFAATITTALGGKLDKSSVSAFALTLLDDANAAEMRTTLGLGALATLSSVGTTQLANDSVTNVKLAKMPTMTLKGNNTAATADPIDLTVAQVKVMLALAIADVTGLQAALDGKAAAAHTHAWADITGKPTTFAPTAHTHAISEITGLQAALDAKAVEVDTDYVAAYNNAKTT